MKRRKIGDRRTDNGWNKQRLEQATAGTSNGWNKQVATTNTGGLHFVQDDDVGEGSSPT
jgi:hypothetical protein